MYDCAFRSCYRSLVTLVLLTSGLFQLAVPVLAAGTAAGTPINNRATATYEDANTPGVQINTTSNTVTVTVAEVAGLTNVPAGIIDPNGGSVSTNDTLNFDFLVTNVGNEATNIRIPGATNITTQNLTITSVTADLDNDGIFETTIPAAGFTTTTPILADANVRVRVTGTVTATTAGSTISVQFGDTPPNDNSAATQNQTSTNVAADVTTVNAAGAAPVNGEREASALSTTTLATAVTTRALATVLKTRALYNPQTSATTDDLITYRLDLRVPATPPLGTSFTVGALEGNAISVNGVTADYILVSDVIPTGTVFDPTFTPTAPAGWQVVYSISDPATINALNALWTTTQPAANTIRRVGYVRTGTIAPGTTTEPDVNGFRFRVVTTNLTTGGQVANIAQAFGQTVGDPANTVIYDESGDQNPNNYDGTNPGAPFNPATDLGIANPTVQGTDNNNDNTGQGAGGEANVLFIAPAGSILNGPQSQPGAVGPTNNMDDFTNRSSTNTPAGNTGTYDPTAVNFTNTVQNPVTNTSNLDNVVLRPISPSQASAATAGTFGTNADIPTGTTVTITLGAQTATYTFDGTNFNLTAGAPVVIASLAPGVSQPYTVSVDLPTTTQLTAFPIPVISFVDNNGDGVFNSATAEPVFNLTVDRVYTGFVRLVKQFSLLDANGNVIQAFPADPLDPTQPTAVVQPGQFIQYRITYVNISTANAGSGNVILNANNLVITEDGTAAPNNWASFTTNVANSAADARGTITYYTGTIPANGAGGSAVDPGNTTTGYRDVVSGTLAPGATGSFTFRRRVN